MPRIVNRPDVVVFVLLLAMVDPAPGRSDGAVVSQDGGLPRHRPAGVVPVEIDAVAVRAYARSAASGGGEEVPLPAPGQEVFFHVSFRVEGVVGSADVFLRATLDGATHCSFTTTVPIGQDVIGFCNSAWLATAGSHALRWEVQPVGASDADETNNAVAISWEVGGAVDLRVSDAHLRPRMFDDQRVDQPVVGQEVYFHALFDPGGVPASSEVTIRAEVDGEFFCGGAIAARDEERLISCPSPWTVTPGPHTVRWVVDVGDVVNETNEDNNEAEVSWISRSPTAPPPTVSQAPTATEASPTMTPSPSPGGPTATPTFNLSVFPDFFGRGDTDCNLVFNAVDLLAQVRGIGGGSSCGNDDCDRDGSVTEADVACTIGCLFADCPVPPGAPEVDAVVPESANDFTPFSLVRVVGSALVSEDGFVRVLVGDEIAPVVEADESELLILLPALDPGRVDLVVLDGERNSRRHSLDIVESRPIGDFDGLMDVLALFVEMVDAFVALDLGGLYDDDTLALIRGLTEQLRADLAALESDELDQLPEEARSILDQLVDGSGIADAIREQLKAGVASNAETSQVGQRALDETRQAVQRAAAATASLTRKYPTTRLARLARFGRNLVKAAGRLVAVAGTILNWKEALERIRGLPEEAAAPAIVGARYFDADGNERNLPTAGGTLRVRGCRVVRETTEVEVKLQNGSVVPLPAVARCSDDSDLSLCPQNPIPPFENDCVVYQLPDSVGFCGTVDLQSYNKVPFGRIAGSSSRLFVQPEILSGVMATPPVHAELVVRGVAGCSTAESRVLWQGPGQADAVWEPTFFDVARSPLRQPTIRVLTSVLTDEEVCVTRQLAPGNYFPILTLGDATSAQDLTEPVVLETIVAALQISCEPGTVPISQSAECTFRPARLGFEGEPSTVPVNCFPVDTDRVDGNIDDVELLEIPGINEATGTFTVRNRERVADGAGEAFVVRVVGREPGVANLTGSVFLDGDQLLVADAIGTKITVVDRTPPTFISVSPCDGTVQAGDVLRIAVRAADNFLMSRLIATLPDGAASPSRQETPCLSLDPKTCEHTFEFPLDSVLEPGLLTADFEAFDGSGLSSTTQCEFDVTEPTEPPRKLVDTDVTLPGSSQKFTSFLDFGVYDGTVVFRSNNNNTAVFFDDGDGIELLTDTAMLPDPITAQVRHVAIHGRSVLVVASPSGEPCDRVLVIDVDSHTPGSSEGIVEFPLCELPGSSEVSGGADVFYAALSGEQIGFGLELSGEPSQGLYLVNRVGRPIVVRAVTGFSFVTVSTASVQNAFDGGNFVFRGVPEDGGSSGVHRVTAPGAVETIADQDTIVPTSTIGSDRRFNNLCGVAIDGRKIAFVGTSGTALAGVYKGGDRPLEVVAEKGSELADRGRRLQRFFCEVASDDDNIVFRGSTSTLSLGPGGIFVSRSDGSLITIVEEGDMLDGKIVDGVSFNGDKSLHGDELVFRVIFEDRSAALYLARF